MTVVHNSTGCRRSWCYHLEREIEAFTIKSGSVTGKMLSEKTTKLLMARLPTIFLNCFKFTLHKGIFDQVLCFSSLNPSLDTHGVTGLLLQLRNASGTLHHLFLDLVFAPQHSNLFSKLIFIVTGFQGLTLLCL